MELSQNVVRPHCKLVALSKLWLTAFLVEALSAFVWSSSKVFQSLQQNHNGMFQLLIAGPLQVRQTCVS